MRYVYTGNVKPVVVHSSQTQCCHSKNRYDIMSCRSGVVVPSRRFTVFSPSFFLACFKYVLDMLKCCDAALLSKGSMDRAPVYRL